jgi:signal transduction histidine kinase
LSICELISQSQEKVNELNELTIQNVKFSLQSNFDQIKSFSDFLLILVKDLNYFSEVNLDKNIKIEEKETRVDEVVNFISRITQSLLNRYNKSKFVNFQIELDSEVPKILTTDEWRLKQVLVNLLSNAVKFTLHGQVLLKICLEKCESSVNHMVKFLVKDTGVGIKKCNELKLFTPFQKGSHVNNEIGSGLGLYIAQEIATKLGTGLEYVSMECQGTSFWFSIPLKEESAALSIRYSQQSSKFMIISPRIDKDELNDTNKLDEININTNEISSSVMDILYKEDINSVEKNLTSLLNNIKESESFSIISNVSTLFILPY